MEIESEGRRKVAKKGKQFEIKEFSAEKPVKYQGDKIANKKTEKIVDKKNQQKSNKSIEIAREDQKTVKEKEEKKYIKNALKNNQNSEEKSGKSENV